MKLSIFDTVAMVLVIVGGINWGLVGLVDFNLVTTLFGVGSMVTKVVYILVGVSAVYLVSFVLKGCGCMGKSA